VLKNNLILALNTGYKDKRGMHALRVRAIIKGRPDYEDTGIRLTEDQWDDAGQRIINHRNATRLNAEARRKFDEVENWFDEAERRGDPISKIPRNRPAADFTEYCKRRLENEYKPTLDKDTVYKYDGFVRGFAEVYPALPFSKVSAQLLKLYEANQRAEGNSDNTLHKKMGYLLREAKAAAVDKLIDPEKLKGYAAPKYTHPKRSWLTKDEVNAIEKLSGETNQPRIRKVCDWFLFSCYSGLRYSDVKAFAPSMIDGEIVRLIMKKTNDPVEVPLHPRLRAVLTRMDAKVDSNQQCNLMLKVIATAAGITKNLSMHIGRHTYAVLHLDAGGSLEVLQELLGQKDFNTTKIYGKMTSQRKANEVANVWAEKDI
jgi:integrase